MKQRCSSNVKAAVEDLKFALVLANDVFSKISFTPAASCDFCCEIYKISLTEPQQLINRMRQLTDSNTDNGRTNYVLDAR